MLPDPDVWPERWWRPEVIDAARAAAARARRRDGRIVSTAVTLTGGWLSAWTWLTHGPDGFPWLGLKLAIGVAAGHVASRMTRASPEAGLPAPLGAIAIIVVAAMFPIDPAASGLLKRGDPAFSLLSPLLFLVFCPLPLYLWHVRRRPGLPDAETCLVEAAFQGDLEAVRIVGRGVDVDAGGDYPPSQSWKCGFTPLLAGVWTSDLAVVRFVLGKGADPNHDLSGTGSPLRIALARPDHPEIAALLRARRARDFVTKRILSMPV